MEPGFNVPLQSSASVGSLLHPLMTGGLSGILSSLVHLRSIEQSRQIHTENLEFQRERFEQEKAQQWQIAEKNRQTQLEQAQYQRATSLKLLEAQKVFENWPLSLLPTQIIESHSGSGPLPLRILVAPPKVQFDQIGNTEPGLPQIEKKLADGLRQFLEQNYSLHSYERPTEFLGGAWVSKRFHSEASIKALFSLLKSEPTLILETEAVGDDFIFRVAYWGLGQKQYFYQTITKFSYSELMRESAKARALEWKENKAQLLKAGYSQEQIIELWGKEQTDEINLQTLEREEKLRSLGIDPKERITYKLTESHFKEVIDLLITYHCIAAGWVADCHYLIHYDVSPLLPQLLPDLPPAASEPQVLRTIFKGYQNVYKSLEQERPFWVPELALKFAESLAYLPDKTLAKEQLDYSYNSWVQQHFVTKNSLALLVEDRRYLENLIESLKTLEDFEYALEVQLYLNAIKDFKEAEHRRKLENVSLVQTLTEHSSTVCTVAISPNGQTLVSGSNDETIKIWNLSTGELRTTLTGHSNRVFTVAISPDGQTLVSGSWDKTIKIWNLSTGELRTTLTEHSSAVCTVAISLDGQTLVSSSCDETIKIWNLSTGALRTTLTGHPSWVYTVAISPDGQTLVSGSCDETIKIWNLSTGALRTTLTGHPSAVNTVAISPDGQTLVSGGRDAIKIWRVNTSPST